LRKQLGRDGERVDPKTEESQRDVLLLPALARVLPEANVASSYSGPGDFVFASETGTPLQARHVARRGVAKAVANAGLNPDGKRRIGWHLLRHGFGSMLLAQGENVVFVSRQLGHKDPRITLGIYAHEFNQDAQLEHGARPARRSAWNIVGNRPWRRAASGGDGERCRCRTVAADRRLAATHREPCSGLTSRGSLVRARHRPTRKGLETGPFCCQPWRYGARERLLEHLSGTPGSGWRLTPRALASPRFWRPAALGRFARLRGSEGRVR
jgi:hypothetical protein